LPQPAHDTAPVGSGVVPIAEGAQEERQNPVKELEFVMRTKRARSFARRQPWAIWLRMALGLASMCVLAAVAQAGKSNTYEQINIASNRPTVPNHMDPRLINAWGLVISPTGLLYVADNGTGLSTIYSPSGIPFPFSISVPSPTGATTSSPTGVVFNATESFKILSNGNVVPATFLFSTEDGGIAGWYAPTAPAHAVVATDRSVANAVYKGLAVGHAHGADRLYATDFHNAHVDVFDGNFSLQNDPMAFVDPYLPPGYAPFGISDIEGSIVVTYAKQKPPDNHDDDAGPGHGFVDLFRTDGTFVRRIASEGELNSPWGIALAPTGFGPLGHALLIGNFGDGRILAYNVSTGAFLGVVRDETGKTIVIPGLWSIVFRPNIENDGVPAGETRLYFTSGPADESNGVMGFIRPTGPLN
jgi:uncharacterized protein (TIGR03118 family)